MPSIIKGIPTNGIIIFFLGILLSTSVLGQNKFEKLNSELEQAFLKDSLPGLAVILVNTNGIVYKKSFGFADAENKKPYTINSIQNIGSVSKTFIAVALMKAIELNYFTLETDINDILPFKVINPNHPGDKITIRELANHTSGIIDNPAIYPNSYKFYLNMRGYSKAAFDAAQAIGYQQKVNDTSLAQFFYNYLSEKGKYYSQENFGKGAAGSTSSYSNIGSALVAYLIEIKSGVSYAEFATKYILKPLQMENSGWFLSSIDLKKHAKLYYTGDQYFPLYNLLTYPDGGLKTSANDLSKYLISIIKGYNGVPKLLKPESYKVMFTPQFSTVSPPKDISLSKRNKGIFWNLYANGTIGHDGDDPGISTFLFFNTQTGMGGLFMCNKYLPNKQPIIDLLLEAAK
jgi:CubicO group peptidase (beta-lactamase class C family)